MQKSRNSCEAAAKEALVIVIVIIFKYILFIKKNEAQRYERNSCSDIVLEG